MRKCAADFIEFHAFGRDQVVYDAYAGFGHDGELVIHQMVVILMHAAGEGIFDGHHGAGGAAVFQSAEEVLKAHAGKHFHVRTAQSAGGFLAEGAALALERNHGAAGAHRSTPSQRRTAGSGRPIKSSTRSTLWSTTSITVCGW